MNRGGFRQPSIYSRTQQDPEKKNYKKIFLSLSLIILVCGSVYLLFLSPIFKINEIELNQIKYQDKKVISKTLSDYKNKIIFNDNLLFISPRGLKNELMLLPGIKNVVIIKKYPNTLILQFEEREPVFVWQSLDHKYLVDDSGTIWSNYEDKYANLPLVIDSKNVPTSIGKKPVAANFSRFINDLRDNFLIITGVKYSKMEVIDTTNELKVVSTDGWYAYFDTTRYAKNELLNLNKILEEAKKTNKKTLEYIDLRIENKIFYK